MSLANSSTEYVVAAGKVSPPIAVTGFMALGLSLQDWVLSATLLYTVVQTMAVIYKVIKDRKNGG